MGSFSDYLENKWLGHILKSASFTHPANIYMALSTADPTDAGTGLAEPSGNNYSRATITSNFTAAAATRAIANNSDIVFPQASGSWGTISHWAIFDSGTAGNMLAYGSITTPKAIGANQAPKILSGQCSISIPAANGMTTYLANEMLDHTFKSGDAGFTVPTNLYLCLGITATFDDTGVWTNECAATGSYARINNNTWTVTASAAENTGAMTSAVATGSWGTIAYWGLSDNATRGAGNMLLYGTWDASASIIADDQFNVVAGGLDITLD